MKRSIVALGVGLAAVSWGGAARADYASAGPEATKTSALAPTGGATGGFVVVPKAAGTYPLLVTSHGWSAGADNQLGWAEHFASYGFVVVVPELPSPYSPDPTTQKNVIVALVKSFTDPSFASPAKGKVDVAHVGLEGHSAGGVATTLAAAELRPGATVLFDPVDKNDAGKGALPKVCTPILSLFAAAGGCNNQAAWAPLKGLSTGPTLTANVVGATHCDGENAPRTLCGPFCGGGASATRQDVHARYATAFFLAHLKGDAAAAATLTATALAADTTLSQTSVKSGAACAAGPAGTDAGTEPATKDDAGSPSSSTPSDPAPSSSGTAKSPSTGGTSNEASGGGGTEGGEGGCATAAPSRSSLLVSLGLAFAAVVAARRRARRPG